MARHFYAYLTQLMQSFYSGIAEESHEIVNVIDGLLSGMDKCEMLILVGEIDRLLSYDYSEEELLQKMWGLGAHDFPKGPIRKTLASIREHVHSRMLRVSAD